MMRCEKLHHAKWVSRGRVPEIIISHVSLVYLLTVTIHTARTPHHAPYSYVAECARQTVTNTCAISTIDIKPVLIRSDIFWVCWRCYHARFATCKFLHCVIWRQCQNTTLIFILNMFINLKIKNRANNRKCKMFELRKLRTDIRLKSNIFLSGEARQSLDKQTTFLHKTSKQYMMLECNKLN